MEFINATLKEEKIITSILNYLRYKYSNKYDYDKLLRIEVVDALENGASARTFEHTIIVARKNGIKGIFLKEDEYIETKIKEDSNFHMLVSTLFHEMWHINTWDLYLTMYRYILYNYEENILKAMAYRYWIEYIAHRDTTFFEEESYMKNFCENFVNIKWHKKEYGFQEMIIQMPYFILKQILAYYSRITEHLRVQHSIKISSLYYVVFFLIIYYETSLILFYGFL